MKNILSLSIFVGILALAGCQVIGRDPLLHLTLRVVDDEDRPVEKAHVRVGADRRPKPGESEGKSISMEGFTNSEGYFTVELETWNAFEAGYQVQKEGYYGLWLPYRSQPSVRGKWQPWNPTIKVVLKRIRNPVPMYAKKLALSLPALNQPVGYDFVIGDWVAPHGSGKASDITFVGKSIREGDRKFDWQLQLMFPNNGDGIQRFKPDPMTPGLRSAYEAPENGYASDWKLRRWRTGPDEPEQTTFEGKGGYYFRVRTELDAQGKIVKALYGKIYGDFFDMVYYLNPDGTRNIEFDPKQNLFKPRNYRDRDNYAVGP